jgi:hypothetical protein
MHWSSKYGRKAVSLETNRCIHSRKTVGKISATNPLKALSTDETGCQGHQNVFQKLSFMSPERKKAHGVKPGRLTE